MLSDEERRELVEYLQTGKHLPKFLRDFHDQKDLFKCIGNFDDNSPPFGTPDQKGPYAVTWVQGQIYCIDKFLWFMAAHGYELQRSRKKGVPRKDIDETIEQNKKESMEAFRQMLDERKPLDVEEAVQDH